MEISESKRWVLIVPRFPHRNTVREQIHRASCIHLSKALPVLGHSHYCSPTPLLWEQPIGFVVWKLTKVKRHKDLRAADLFTQLLKTYKSFLPESYLQDLIPPIPRYKVIMQYSYKASCPPPHNVTNTCIHIHILAFT